MSKPAKVHRSDGMEELKDVPLDRVSTGLEAERPLVPGERFGGFGFGMQRGERGIQRPKETVPSE
jgi:hypothetical protein